MSDDTDKVIWDVASVTDVTAAFEKACKGSDLTAPSGDSTATSMIPGETNPMKKPKTAFSACNIEENHHAEMSDLMPINAPSDVGRWDLSKTTKQGRYNHPSPCRYLTSRGAVAVCFSANELNRVKRQNALYVQRRDTIVSYVCVLGVIVSSVLLQLILQEILL